jgi:hypothetical protein
VPLLHLSRSVHRVPQAAPGRPPLTLGVSLSSVLSLLLPNSFIARLAVGGWFGTGTLQ